MLKEAYEQNLCPWDRQRFLKQDIKSTKYKRKKLSQSLLKSQIFALQKTMLEKKRQAKAWMSIFEIHVSNKQFVVRKRKKNSIIKQTIQ